MGRFQTHVKAELSGFANGLEMGEEGRREMRDATKTWRAQPLLRMLDAPFGSRR